LVPHWHQKDFFRPYQTSQATSHSHRSQAITSALTAIAASALIKLNGETEDDIAGGTKTLWSTLQSAFDTAIAFADLQAGDVSEHAPCFACITFLIIKCISPSHHFMLLWVC
jgi:hypothetical protein